MTINSTEEFLGAIRLLVMQMDRQQRKQFLAWVKMHIKKFDFNYPLGYKIEEAKEPIIIEPKVELILPQEGIIEA